MSRRITTILVSVFVLTAFIGSYMSIASTTEEMNKVTTESFCGLNQETSSNPETIELAKTFPWWECIVCAFYQPCSCGGTTK